MSRKESYRVILLTVMVVITLTVVTIGYMALSGPGEPADMVIMNGTVATVDQDFSIREAVAVSDGKIVYVGKNRVAKRFIDDNTVVLDVEGKLVLPGLIDAHGHLHSLGEQLANLDINGTKSWEEIIERVEERVKTLKPGEWIVGGRWNQNEWPVREFPVHDELSRVSPNNPVYLIRVDGNSAFANRKAMELAGISRNTPDPDGGRFIRDEKGEPTGVLINQTMNYIKRILPDNTTEMKEAKFKLAVQACIEAGLTGVHEAGVGPAEIAMYKELIDRGELDMRIYAMLGEQERPVLNVDLLPYFLENRIPEYGNHMLSVRAIKLYFDGALGSRGAAFFEPYADDPENTGLLRIPPEYIVKVTKAALEADMGVATHCIGIRGTRLCIDAYEEALNAVPVKDHRLRVEHAQIVRREDVEKFTKLNIIPSMQPTHATSDMSFVADRVGDERAEGAYAWRWFLDAGLTIPMGSDFPVEAVNPLYGIYSAVTRQDHEGLPTEGWFPQHKLTIEEAIRGFTIWAAYAAYQEDVLGSIETGKLADFTIIDTNILETEPSEILNTKVLYTIVGGKIRYR
ncbi:MAG: amidohydrolase [Bacteroidales bacterium]